jgi:hypothetical protein
MYLPAVLHQHPFAHCPRVQCASMRGRLKFGNRPPENRPHSSPVARRPSPADRRPRDHDSPMDVGRRASSPPTPPGDPEPDRRTCPKSRAGRSMARRTPGALEVSIVAVWTWRPGSGALVTLMPCSAFLLTGPDKRKSQKVEAPASQGPSAPGRCWVVGAGRWALTGVVKLMRWPHPPSHGIARRS